jgi:hypothetical protein
MGLAMIETVTAMQKGKEGIEGEEGQKGGEESTIASKPS